MKKKTTMIPTGFLSALVSLRLIRNGIAHSIPIKLPTVGHVIHVNHGPSVFVFAALAGAPLPPSPFTVFVSFDRFQDPSWLGEWIFMRDGSPVSEETFFEDLRK